MNNESRKPLKHSEWNSRATQNEITYSGLVTSLHSETRSECRIVGEWPRDLSGILYRTGPGIFERGDHRRRMIIDADGMMRSFNISNGIVSFANKHIRTERFIAEEKSDRYLYPSFAMKSSSPGLANSIVNLKNQASVTTFFFGGRLFATDEMQPIIEIDPNTLETLGTAKEFSGFFKAHTRVIGTELHLASVNPVTSRLQFHVYDETFKLVRQSLSVKVNRIFHDWHVTPNFYAILLPPVYMNKLALANALIGRGVIGDAFEFRAKENARLLVIPRDGKKFYEVPLSVHSDSWHSINAFEKEDNLVLDFIATEGGLSPVSDLSAMSRIMRGELEASPRKSQVYRTVVSQNRLISCKPFGPASVEMPTLDPRFAGVENQNSYFIAGNEGLDSKLLRYDSFAKKEDIFDFGDGHFVTEPIFAQGDSQSYLLSEVYSHETQRSKLTIFLADDIAHGPIAEALLDHHLPVGFHGTWVSRSKLG